jgi:hypothetical protein
LAEYYGADAVFMDIDSIPFGIDFRQQIQEVVTKNHIMLVLIGPKWMGAKKGGISRISGDKDDPIRIEIETALKQRMPLIPVLVGGASMPKSSALPESLQKLCFLNAAEVDDGRDFHQHLDRLIRAMDRLLTDSKLGALEQKSQSRPIRDDLVSLRPRDVAAAPKEQVPKKPQRSRDIGRTTKRRISLIFLRANNNNGTGCFACCVCWMALDSSSDREADACNERVPWVDCNSCRVRCFCGELHEPGTTLLADLLVSYLGHTRSGLF